MTPHSLKRLPPLGLLRAFESVGRLLSFTRAGEELCVTQAAVSRQIRALEQHLDTALFVRRTRSVSLTAAGSAYLPEIRRAFDLIGAGADALRPAHSRAIVQVSLLASFAGGWLIARLPRFRDLHPDVELSLDTTVRQVDVDLGEVDIAIRYGRGHWPNVRSWHLLGEELVPVCSPRYLAAHGLITAVDELSRHPILHASLPVDWDAWLEGTGVTSRSLPKSHALHDYNIVIRAAVEGQGIAMGRKTILADRLAAGDLVPMSPRTVAGQVGYHVVEPRIGMATVATLFADWLRGEVALMTPGNQSQA